MATGKRQYVVLTDRLIEAVHDFAEGEPHIRYDRRVAGLRVHFGKRKVSFSFFRQHRIHGKRSTTAITLGEWPMMTVADARKAALVEAGRIAAGRVRPGKRSAIKVKAAIDDYIEHLKTRKAGSQWARNVASIAKVHILPEFEK